LLFGAPGTPALTSRGFIERDFVKVAEFFDAAVKLALKIKADAQGPLLSSLKFKLFFFYDIMHGPESYTPWLYADSDL
jgi:hypothetical protein